MSYAANLLPEFDHEMSNTEKILECVTVDLMNWRAEESMNTIGWNANHLAEIPGWVEGILTKLEWDIAPVGEQPYQSPALSDPQAILELFRTNVQTGRQAIEQFKSKS